jgi:hypothetical protein
MNCEWLTRFPEHVAVNQIKKTPQSSPDEIRFFNLRLC